MSIFVFNLGNFPFISGLNNIKASFAHFSNYFPSISNKCASRGRIISGKLRLTVFNYFFVIKWMISTNEHTMGICIHIFRHVPYYKILFCIVINVVIFELARPKSIIHCLYEFVKHGKFETISKLIIVFHDS